MNRNQLLVLLVAGTAAAAVWGAVLLQDSEGHGNEDSAAVWVNSTAARPTRAEPVAPRATVPADLRVPTIKPGRGGMPCGGVPRNVLNSPSAVATAFVKTMWSYDTAIDTTSHDAAARAALWATDSLASTLAQPGTRTTPTWDEWLRHDAYTRARVVSAPSLGQDVETAARWRTYRVDVLVVGDDGYRDRLETFLVSAALVRDNGRWLVDRITLT